MEKKPKRRAIKVSVPGKIMLAGEYAILKGGRSLSATVGARLSLSISESSDFRVRSNLWPTDVIVPLTKSTEPLIDSLQYAGNQFDIGHALVEVRSDLPVSFGLGSSSAVRLAAHIGLKAFAEQTVALKEPTLWASARDAWMLQKEQQGFASGYDLVTQLHGSFIAWQPDYASWPGTIKRLDLDWLNEWVHPYAGGEGAPTTMVGGSVKEWLFAQDLWCDLKGISEDLIEAFLAKDFALIIQANRAHRELFQKAPFYPSHLYKLLASIDGFDRSWTFKTTGAGGEDAILLIGHTSDLTEVNRLLQEKGWNRLDSPWSSEGCQLKWKDA